MSVIKPPGGNDPTEIVRKATESALEKASEASGPAAAADVGAPDHGTQAGPVAGSGSAAAVDDLGPLDGAAPLDALAADLDAGRVPADAVADALVERALADVETSLSASERAELEATLRSALKHDPTLQQLREGWPEG